MLVSTWNPASSSSLGRHVPMCASTHRDSVFFLVIKISEQSNHQSYWVPIAVAAQSGPGLVPVLSISCLLTPKPPYPSLKCWLKAFFFPSPEQKSPFHAVSPLLLSSKCFQHWMRLQHKGDNVLNSELDSVQQNAFGFGSNFKPTKNWKFKVQRWFVGEKKACEEGL